MLHVTRPCQMDGGAAHAVAACGCSCCALLSQNDVDTAAAMHYLSWWRRSLVSRMGKLVLLSRTLTQVPLPCKLPISLPVTPDLTDHGINNWPCAARGISRTNATRDCLRTFGQGE